VCKGTFLTFVDGAVIIKQYSILFNNGVVYGFEVEMLEADVNRKRTLYLSCLLASFVTTG
jgi:hypothetical protein